MSGDKRNGDAFVAKAVETVSNISEGIVAKREDFDEVIKLMLSDHDQVIKSLDKIINVSKTRTGSRPPAVFVMTADEPVSGDGAVDVNMSINMYVDMKNLSAPTQFRIRTELGLPILCRVEWTNEPGPGATITAVRREEGGRINIAKVVLADMSEINPGVARTAILLEDPKNSLGWDMFRPGSTLDLYNRASSKDPVGKVFIEDE